MYRNIMVPVDGSSFAREAVLHGLRIASLCGANLRLVRVETAPGVLTTTDELPMAAEAFRDLRSAALANLYSIAVECRSHSTVNVTASLQTGPVVDALIGYARRHSVDLIVMRSHARGGLARAWLGSIADRLIRDSGIPVVVLRPPSIATGIDSGIQFKRIMVPLDGSSLAEQSVKSAASIARMDGSMLTLVRVVPRTKPKAGVAESQLGPASADEVHVATRYLDAIAQTIPLPAESVKTRVVISGDVATTIMHLAETSETDMIAIATRGRNAFARATSGSVADRIMRESTTSVLVLHPGSGEPDVAYVPITFQPVLGYGV